MTYRERRKKKPVSMGKKAEIARLKIKRKTKSQYELNNSRFNGGQNGFFNANMTIYINCLINCVRLQQNETEKKSRSI